MGTGKGGKPLSDRFSLGTRSQNEVLSVVLVLGMVIIGAIAVVGLGATAIGDTENQLSVDRAEKTLTQLDSKAGLVAIGQADSQRVAFPTDSEDEFRIDEESGQMKITVTNLTTNEKWDKPVLNVTLGSIVYEGEDTKIAYQGGGVWRVNENGGAMVSPPEFHYRNKTLTLPTVTISGEGSLEDGATIQQDGTEERFPTDDVNKTNPMDNHIVTVEVESEYYRAWGQYFEQRTDGSVEYPEPNTVRLNLTTPAEGRTVDGAVIANDGAVSTEFDAKSEVDSYNSEVGEYPAGGGDGAIYHSGEITMKNGAELSGSLVIEAKLQMKKDSRIDGNLTHSGAVDFKESPSTHVNGDIDTGASVPDPEPVDYLIGQKVSEFKSDNDNTPTIPKLENRDPCTPCNLSTGRYYLDQFDLRGGDSLGLEPNGGTIEIVVDDYFTVKNDATIEVIGDGKVEVYVKGDTELENSATIQNDGDNAPQFWMFMTSERSFRMKQGSEYTGVVYGPKTESFPGVKVNMDQDTQLYGAIVGKVENIKNNADVHYDTALGSTSVFDESDDIVPVTFLHVTTNSVNITG